MKRTLAETKIQGTWLLLSLMILAGPSLAASPTAGGFHSGSSVTGLAMMQHAASEPAPHSAPAAPQHSTSSPAPHSASAPASHATTGRAPQSQTSTGQHSANKPTASQPSIARTTNQSGTSLHPTTHPGGSTKSSSTKGPQAPGASHNAGQAVKKRPDGSTVVKHASGASVVYDKNDRIREVTTRGGAVAKIG